LTGFFSRTLSTALSTSCKKKPLLALKAICDRIDDLKPLGALLGGADKPVDKPGDNAGGGGSAATSS